MYRPIRDYAIIGNLRSAILISKDASIDWAPAPFIDSPSIFAALLDDQQGGFWSITPEEKYTSSQKYLHRTNVLVTAFETSSGTLEVTDFIPIEKNKDSFPPEEDTTFRIHRKIHCTEGSCRVKVIFHPCFDYARGETTLSAENGGILVQNQEKHGMLASRADFVIAENEATATILLEEGESEYLVFRYNAGKIPLPQNEKIHHEEELAETISYWREWAHTCPNPDCPAEGAWEEMVNRSELVLKVLFFEPVGTVAAAATTSLPEAIGGVRNWDYRFTWIRDSAFIFENFLKLGHLDEAESYLQWLVSKCFRSADSDLFEGMQIMYPLRDETPLDEEILPHLEGYSGSRPVRIGNDAYRQKQWDIFGSILHLIWSLYEVKTDPPSRRIRDLVHGIGNHVMEIWREPDEGLWEIRGGKEHFTYSKAMCSVALDRAAKFSRKYGEVADAERFEKEKNIIVREIHRRSWNPEMNSFTQSFDSQNLDASLLRLSAVGFIDGKDPKMLGTIEAIQKGLKQNSIYLKRYTAYDGLPGGEGAFLLSSFWLVDALILAGKVDEAKEIFEKILAKANHVGLYAEEIDASTGDFLGNFPQAYTHIGLLSSAFHLAEARRKNEDFAQAAEEIYRSSHSLS
ncbi:MAG TPA: glycoside hydrolase family 15 protein [Candidatus Paceibacterota bacterium]|nr:glycoside hydrolase family 15 protein [Candidatus Paceibacterota bacterium]